MVCLVPADSDAGAAPPRRRRVPYAVLAVISAGGALGGLARYALAVALPQHAGAFPRATFVTNVSGCAFIGILMVLVVEVWSALVAAGAARTALAYLAGTLVAALAAVYAGATLTRLATRTLTGPTRAGRARAGRTRAGPTVGGPAAAGREAGS